MHSAKCSLNLIILLLCAYKTIDNYLAVCRLCNNKRQTCFSSEMYQSAAASDRQSKREYLYGNQHQSSLFVVLNSFSLSWPILQHSDNRERPIEMYSTLSSDLSRFTTSYFLFPLWGALLPQLIN